MKKKSKQHQDANLSLKLLPEDEVPLVHVITHSLGGATMAHSLGRGAITYGEGRGIIAHTLGRDIGLTFDPDLKIVRAEVTIQIGEPSAEQLPQPPAFGEALLVLFCLKNRVDAVMGDLEERFTEDVAAKGEKHAKLLFWTRVVRSIGPLLWVKVRKAGLIALLFEIGRRWCGLS